MKVELKSIDNFVFNDTKDLQFTGVVKSTHKDCDGNIYKLESNNEKYLFFAEVFGARMFVSETYILEILLAKDIEDIESRSIYEHGYPESRLMPSNHKESCEESLLETVKESINEKIESILYEYF